MNRKETIIVALLIVASFTGSAFAASIQQVFVTNFPSNQKVTVSNIPGNQNTTVTNFPKDTTGNIRVTEQNPKPVNVTVNQQLPSKQIVLFNGNLVSLGYRVNQTSSYRGNSGSTIVMGRNYTVTVNQYLTQYFQLMTNTTFTLNYGFTFVAGSGGCCSTTSSTTVYSGGIRYLGLSFSLNPGTTNVTYTFNVPANAAFSFEIRLLATASSLDNIPRTLTLPEMNATGYRKLTLHASAMTNFTIPAPSPYLDESLYDPATASTFGLAIINYTGCPGVISNCFTYSLEPPFIVQSSFNGIGDFYNVKIVAYIWN